MRASRNIQGNILAAFNKDNVTFRLVNFTDAPNGRKWLAGVLGEVAVTEEVEDANAAFSAARAAVNGEDPPNMDRTWLSVSLTAPGLRLVAADPQP